MTAPCAGLYALFDAEDEASQARAAAICSGCDIRQACHDGAVERDEPQGTWGGRLFPIVLLDGMPVDVAPVVVHGTRTARNNGCTCRRCLDAHARYVAEWRRRDVTPAVKWEQTAIDWEAAS